MGKDETTEKDDATTKSQGGKDEAADSGSATDLKPVSPKIGESKDNLRKREEWFQKRTGGG
jgi:hypothetical protein